MNDKNTSSVPTKCPCNRCGRATNHALLHSEPGFHGDDYQVLRCRGCDALTFRVDDSKSPFSDPEHPENSMRYYPPRISRELPQWWGSRALREGQPTIAELLEEVYQALWAGSRRLAMMGMRTIVDVAIQSAVGDKGTFAEGLNALVDQGYVGAKAKDHLAAAIDAGHATAHRGHNPTDLEVSIAMDIVENIVQAAFILEHAGAVLKKRTPKRK